MRRSGTLRLSGTCSSARVGEELTQFQSTLQANETTTTRQLFLEVSRIDCGKVVEFFGQILDGENGAALAGRDAGAATEALLGVDE